MAGWFKTLLSIVYNLFFPLEKEDDHDDDDDDDDDDDVDVDSDNADV